MFFTHPMCPKASSQSPQIVCVVLVISPLYTRRLSVSQEDSARFGGQKKVGRKDKDNHFVGYTYKRKSSTASGVSRGPGRSDLSRLSIPGRKFASTGGVCVSEIVGGAGEATVSPEAAFGSGIGLRAGARAATATSSTAGSGAGGATDAASSAAPCSTAASEKESGVGNGFRSSPPRDSRKAMGKHGLTGIFGGRRGI